MNALANSQEKELAKFLCEGYPDRRGPVTFARYTGQEKDAERQRIIQAPPDILLTNYVMLELILTRPDEAGLIRAAQGLRFLVLDELGGEFQRCGLIQRWGGASEQSRHRPPLTQGRQNDVAPGSPRAHAARSYKAMRVAVNEPFDVQRL